MTVIDLYPGDSIRNPANEDIWELAVNGLSWPYSERLEVAVGDTVRWRWLNGSYLPHPMHLHGFHFRALAKGDGASDTTYAAGAERLAVTEYMAAGTTFRMEWVPTRAGNWLMHCHMLPHVTPYPLRSDSVRAHEEHDPVQHALTAMAGLVMGITAVDRSGSSASPTAIPTRHLRLLAQETRGEDGTPGARGYVLQGDADPRPDSVEVPGPPIVLTRGETTAITVVNRLTEPTTVHWHGLELESVYDGVAGWSRTGGSVGPLLAPGDSFTVVLTPPRAGTFIYHTHMDELEQLRRGMYGPLLVLEPGQSHEPDKDLVFMIGDALAGGEPRATVNGQREPPPLELSVGTRYRLRVVSILPAAPAQVRLLNDTVSLRWRPVAKDGADLAPAARVEGPAFLRPLGTGETYDFEWSPAAPMDAILDVQTGEGDTIRQVLHVRRE
jgi:FtsP/CotA-like multicopper oxidase with cupredoxin domain